MADHAEHVRYMRMALEIAEDAGRQGNLAIGSVIVRDGKVIGCGANQLRTAKSPLIHAETDAIADACRALGTDNLAGSALYTTMEPCPMCAGAMLNANIKTWVMGGRLKGVGRTDMGRYSVETFVDFMAADVQVVTGILPEECQELRNRYFRRQ
jgi:tRNA(adenine34) deaminase